ncbi:MAG: TlyA family rRNA (cytidine-2'-O)-methyltransferase [Rhodovulum sulfidophilum]|uniref:TlyA family rRNA (Cytidine-2'-O)-methyltransferase n=1 Tax=Rhodovulum sulfidophilum TaxID=35806 RepID=A0A2W5NA06_RHOSU|nr:MAG: TlyA family rRNA (cytidine-2'-O)-methyltransferase [Rhodovulum sulfidophilum]
MTRRLDQALVDRGLAESRARAQALIAAGVVTVDGAPETKPARKVAATAALALTADPLPYVSRAALKLVHALDAFALDPSGRVALDLGASTGGFSQVLLERGAAEVWAIDVGHGQLAPALRSAPRLHLIEGLNARDLTAAHVPPPEFIVSDLSFISLEKALPPALGLAAPGATLAALIKPQFEVGPAFVGKGGIVRDAAAVTRVRAGIRAFLETSGWIVLGEDTSPIQGGDGNTEYLIAALKDA